MSSSNEYTRLEIGVGGVVTAVGLFFTLLAYNINPNSFDPIGPRQFPLILAIILVLGGLLLIAFSVISKRHSAHPQSEDGYGFRDSNIIRIVYVIASGAVYIVLFFLLGYFAATLIASLCILLAFGNRKPLTLIGLPVIAAIVYQFVFMGLMKLNDPKGLLLDLRPYTNWLSGN